MKVACLQMDMLLAKPEENFSHAAELVKRAMKDKPDVLVLPETWNTGFFPRENLQALCDRDGSRVRQVFGALAERYQVNIVAGSVSNVRGSKVYNTAMVFDRTGACIASYDKTHLFTPMGEDNYYTPGDRLCTFVLDGVKCGLIICYDVRFPELTRSLTVPGLDMLFVVSQWPKVRTFHLRSLTTARAIENQMFLVCCNSCGTAGRTVYGGNSAIIDPWGETVALAGETEEILTADCDLQILTNIRGSIPVFRDRRPSLYKI
ncbi:MAG: carbon-nitrogen family hydrolase [Faecousia sp.]